MAYEYVKAVCLFCEATVEGYQRYMTGGKSFAGRRGRPPKWLRDKPEHKWAWNGLNNAIFYLCPSHQTDEDFTIAFEWAEANGFEIE